MFGAFVFLLIFGLWENSGALNGQTYSVEHKMANSPDSNFCGEFEVRIYFDVTD